MKKIGLIGGMSDESTITYYKLINKKINERLGKLAGAEIVLSSVNKAKFLGTIYMMKEDFIKNS